ncbi:hypothetical protein HYQ46_000159 [Verticillium longisporum]|nr:hypothetical protein HYQ46_000159 [Verticillium longisporum]
MGLSESESDSSLTTRFLAAPTPLDWRLGFARGSSSESSLIGFFAAGFLALLSCARMALASFAASASMLAFFAASFTLSG